MGNRGRYPAEVRERAVRLVLEHQDEYSSQWAAICSIAHKSGMSPETLSAPGRKSHHVSRLQTVARLCPRSHRYSPG